MNDLLVGALISGLVSGLKRFPFVRNNPRVVTAVLSAAVPGTLATYTALTGHDTAPIAQLAQSAATQFVAAIGTHEAVTHPINALVQPKVQEP